MLDSAREPVCRWVRPVRHDEGMPRPHLMTSRIRLEPMSIEHLPLLVELDSDAEVLRYILGRARTAAEAEEFWAPICSDIEADAFGLGWWIGRRRDNDDFLGWWDLSPHETLTGLVSRAEAGWRLARRHWRQGYATEGATRLLDHGFATIELNVVRAETMAVNQASRRVMTRLGMRHVATDHREWHDPLPGSEHGEVIYEINRSVWVTARRQTTVSKSD